VATWEGGEGEPGGERGGVVVGKAGRNEDAGRMGGARSWGWRAAVAVEIGGVGGWRG